MKIAVLDDYLRVAQAMAPWRERLPGAEITYFRDLLGGTEQAAAALRDYQVVVAMRERTAFSRELLSQLPQLRLLVTTGMRNAAIDVAAAKELGVTVCGTGADGATTSELTWALILALLRPVQLDDAHVRDGGWQRRLGGDLGGRTLGLVGLGRQGARVARVAHAFDMNVIAWSPHLTKARAAEHGAECVTKHEVFARADVASVHLVLSDATRAIVGEPELRALGPDSYLVNTARAALVDQAALRQALTSGWIAGAGLDVYDIEPLPGDHWLRTAPRTVLSPHMGYVSARGYRVFYGDAVEDIAAFLRGEPIRLL
ncbi:MAG TPA: D-2-hydroxyacid dehydrogenase family protein [Trebonia sp.]|jgi:phosphoglycerate dehydrogenase-like enzyme